jgi:signal transduction histidine kinase
MPQAAYQTPAPQPRPQADAQARRDAAFDEQKRSFLRMVSHELRTPLNSILGFSEILASELYGPLGDPQYKEYAEIIRGSGHRLLKLVNQVLEIARLEGGAEDLRIRPEAVETALDDIAGSFREDMAARDIRLTVTPAAQAAVVQADPRGLRTVLSNLICNAVAFSPDGAEVRVNAKRQGDHVEILVEDQGEGVDPADLPRLLRPFEQGENALTRRGEGAGLGLAICDLTCQAMGGRLRLTSVLGQGLSAGVRLRAG